MIPRVMVDPPVLATAARRGDPRREVAREVLLAVQGGFVQLALPVTAVTTTVRLLLRDGHSVDFAVARAHDVAGMAQLLDIAPDDALLALRLLERYPRAGGRVAAIAATLRRHQVVEVVTDDPRFDAIPGLARVPPEGVLEL